jgi:2-polyprenyl-3-methyl-5-hydroxy-6-metoxy-1,4-benzoquinol methylase
MDSQQTLQEDEYDFPYHYLVERCPNVSVLKSWRGAVSYLLIQDRLIKRLGSLEFNSLVEIGCGDGKVLREIAKEFPGKRFLGVDYSHRAVQLASLLNPGIEFRTVDVTQCALEPCFDVACLIEVLEHIPPDQIPSFLNAIKNSLGPNGLLFLTVPHENVPLGSKHYQHFSEEKLRRCVEGIYDVQELQHINSGYSGLTRLVHRMWRNRLFTITDPGLTRMFYQFISRRTMSADVHRATGLFATLRPVA